MDFLKDVLMQRNKLLSQVKPSTLQLLRNYKNDVVFNQHLEGLSKEMEIYSQKEARRIQKVKKLKISKKEKKEQILLLEKIRNLNEKILSAISIEKKDRNLSELKTSEPVYSEGSNGFSANKMALAYEETGMDLSSKET